MALLIAASDYSDPDLRQLRAPGRDASELAVVLGDRRIGGFDVQTLINARCDEVQEGIEEFCADRHPQDQLLVYLSCHGVLDDNGRLYYAAANTRRQRLAATAVSAAWLNERLDDCRARHQILVLDCCHSGAFARGTKAMGDSALALQQRFEPQGRGRVVLTASRATEYSFEGDQTSGEGLPSVFTQAIVTGLTTGDADRDKDGRITVHDLHQHVREVVHSAEPRQTPELWTYGAEGDLLVAYSVRGAVAEPVPLPENLRITLENPRTRVREAGIAELVELLDTAGPGLALTARQTLQQIAEQDIPKLAAIARAALRTTSASAADDVPRRAPGYAKWLVFPGRAVLPLLRARLAMVIGAVALVAAIVSLTAIFSSSPGSHSGAAPGWPSSLGGPIYGGPFIANETVYVGDTDGHVYALNATTGKLLWAYPKKGHIGAVNYRPRVAGRTVYFGSQNGNVYAIDGTTGQLRWQVKTGAPVRSSLAYIKGVVYFGSGNNNLQALNAKDGSRYWHQPVPLAGIFEHGPAVYTYEVPSLPLRRRTIYAGAGGFLYALNAASGKYAWKHPAWLGSGDDSIPAVSPDGKTVYVGGSGHAIYALNSATGIPRWSHPHPVRGPIQNQPAVSHDVAYFASGDYVYAVKTDGSDYWKPHDFGASVSGLFVANGSVYVGARDNIFCLDTATGKECQGWHPYKASGQVSAPIFNLGRVYFGTQDGKVYALMPDGSLARPTDRS